ncbi:Molybdate-binding protein ModA [Gammaproteobacteria bacterium]
MKFCITFAALAISSISLADEVSVAVSTNFIAPMQKIAADFEEETGHKAQLAFGATGKFYTQIKNGAPFEILLAADEKTPEKMEKEGIGVANSRFTYAIGRLVLWSAEPHVVDPEGKVLRNGQFEHLALANPKLAPYGAAAMEVMENLGLQHDLQPKFVLGENIAQTQQFVSTGNAEMGFIALSQVFKDGRITNGSAWIVPSNLYRKIRQDAIMLDKGKENPSADSFMKYLHSEKAIVVIRRYGYEI